MESNRRQFFEHLAEEKRFDPLIPANWYSLPTQEILDQVHNEEEEITYEGGKKKLILFLGCEGVSVVLQWKCLQSIARVIS